MDYAIKVSNVSKEYNLYASPMDRVKEAFSLTKKSYHTTFQALSDISFEVKQGETLGIIGKNGAGKSTLLKMITGVATPTSGSIEVNGQISALLELGTGFNPEYNGYQNIYLNGAMRGFTKEQMDQKMDEIISFADIGEYIEQPVKTYSSGMFARLAFAVMISFKPEILIVDEALSVGDVFFQQKCNTFMKENMKGVTKLLVTHDMNSIANMADRAIILDKGHIIMDSTPLETIEYYLKMMHSDVFATSAAKEQPQISETSDTNLDESDWTVASSDSEGGAMEVTISKFSVTVNNMQSEVAKDGDKTTIRVMIHSKKDCGNIILGYTFKDKYGNSIFAQNTLGSGIRVENVKKDKDYILSLSFPWPRIKEGDYFLTLGIGEGEDQMVHTIQCWAHNVIHIQSIATVPMHGVFNHVMNDFSVKEI